MGFLAPFALFGLVAVLVPPLLHLFQRRQPPTLEFPAVRYLQQTEREAERKIRLQHLLLMLLRIAAVILVVLAAARPVVPRGGASFHEPTAVVIVLDNSLSSGAVSAGRRALDDLKGRARETLRASRQGDALWLMGADGVARRGTAEELLAAVEAMQPDSRRLALQPAVRQAARLAAGSGYARAEVHVLTDLQSSAWDAGPARLPGAAEADTAAAVRAGVPVLIYHPAAEPPANVGVADVRAQPAVWLAGTGAVAVQVAGGPAGASAQAWLNLAGRSGPRSVAQPGATITLAAPRAETGWHAGTVDVQPDELRGDDSRPFAVRVVAPAVVAADGEAVLGPFLPRALEVLAENGQVRLAGVAEVVIGTTLRGSGSSIIVPPADAVQLGALNRALAAAGVPWRYGTRLAREDTLVAPLVPELASVRLLARYQFEPVAATAPAAGAVTSEVLARAASDPWLVRHGRVLLVASRLVGEETTLPLSGAFVPFVNALVNRLSRGESGIIAAYPGEPVALPSRARSLGTGDSARTVDGGSVISAPATPGVWAILAGRDTLGMLVVGADPRESDLERAEASEVRRALGGRVSITSEPGDYAAARFRGAGRSELSGWLLLAALLVLVSESLLAAGGLKSRRTVGQTDSRTD